MICWFCMPIPLCRHINRQHCLQPHPLLCPSAMQPTTVLTAILVLVTVCYAQPEPESGSAQDENCDLLLPVCDDTGDQATASGSRAGGRGRRGCRAFGHSCYGGQGK